MKGICLSILLVFLIAGSSIIAQDFHGGVLGGLSASEISGDRLTGPNKAGLYLGAFVNRQFTPHSSAQLELDFIQKGSRKNHDSTLLDTSYLLRLNYFEIPFHYNFHFNEKASLETGLSLGVLIHSYEEANGYETVSGPSFFKTDLSFNIGAFYSLTDKLRINVRYSNSILPVRAHSQGQTYRLNKGQYNEVLSFVLYYEL